MEYVYAALLLHKTGQTISEENIQNVLKAAGAKVEDARVKALVAALEEVDIEEAIKTAAIAAPAATAAPAAAAPAEEKEEKKEEEEEKKEEEVSAGLGALFG
ncbi:MAG: 50S ribosomal protein P1 [Candidatus Odinarchaeia archaeon]